MPENPMMGQDIPEQQDVADVSGQDNQMPPINDDSGESDFDTNFDAGVEADEDEDPKKYIQQLTGKLSQELNKFNNENGDDEELSKYVGKMIAKAAAKGLDEKGRKDLIKAINTADAGEEEEEDTDMPEDDIESSETDVSVEDGGDDEMIDVSQEEQVDECSLSKKECMRLAEAARTVRNRRRSPFDPKEFKP